MANTPLGEDQGSYAEALAAFKRDCDENATIARLLRERFCDELVEPVLDVGAGSGEIASLAFPDRAAFLLDFDVYDAPATQKHKRMTGDFIHLDFTVVRPNTILFCHSLNYLAVNAEALGRQVAASGARMALVVSNEEAGMLKEIAEWLPADVPRSAPAFHVPVVKAELERREPFSARLTCADYQTLARHVLRVLLDIPLNPSVVTAFEQRLRSVLTVPQIEIAEAIYCYRLR